VQITLDGPPEIHDKRRYGPGGEGTFNAIVANISKVLDTGAVLSVRMNVDQTNLEHIDALAKLYHDNGWSRRPNFGAYCQAVFVTAKNDNLGPLSGPTNGNLITISTPSHKGSGLAVSRVQLAEIIERKRKEYPYMRFPNGSFGVDRTFESLMEQGPLRTFHPTFCGTSNDMYVFDAWGDIFVCTEAVGDPSGKVGRYYPKLQFLPAILENFRSRTIMSNPVCRKCAWSLFCGGGCMEHAKQVNGEYHTNFCAQYQSLFVKLVPDAYEHWLRKKRGGKQAESEFQKHPSLLPREEVTRFT
jgi:uncharacterized protein